ncbi:MAG: TlpA family protein disulfide reductase [Oscillospiraceae bacterium]|jgi:thiol-disulfide isomerase/thioredoxin|nr:TlpA family protein disulfide reductase [Oscillospiraceae bacterium]
MFNKRLKRDCSITLTAFLIISALAIYLIPGANAEDDVPWYCKLETPASGAAGSWAASSDVPTDDTEWGVKFSTHTISGDSISQSAFIENKLTILNIFATWCPSCVAELPELGRIADEYAEKGVQLIGVLQDSVNPDTGAVDTSALADGIALLENAGVRYPVLLPDAGLWNAFIVDLQFVPTTFFLDETGAVFKTLLGSYDAQRWVEEIESAIATLDAR